MVETKQCYFCQHDPLVIHTAVWKEVKFQFWYCNECKHASMDEEQQKEYSKKLEEKES